MPPPCIRLEKDKRIYINTQHDFPDAKTFEELYTKKRQQALYATYRAIDQSYLPNLRKRLAKWLFLAETLIYSETMPCDMLGDKSLHGESSDYISAILRTWLEEKGFKIDVMFVSVCRLHIQLSLQQALGYLRKVSVKEKGKQPSRQPQVTSPISIPLYPPRPIMESPVILEKEDDNNSASSMLNLSGEEENQRLLVDENNVPVSGLRSYLPIRWCPL